MTMAKEDPTSAQVFDATMLAAELGAQGRRGKDQTIAERIMTGFAKMQRPAKALRRTGGPGYRNVKKRPNGLFVGNVRIDQESPEDMALAKALREMGRKPAWHSPDHLPPSVAEALDLGTGYHHRLRQCPCGQHFIATWRFHRCNACRQGKEQKVLAAFTAERTAKRLAARATSCAHCANCGKAMVAARSTKRFCSDKCRNASR
jgi:hypothetical protein